MSAKIKTTRTKTEMFKIDGKTFSRDELVVYLKTSRPVVNRLITKGQTDDGKIIRKVIIPVGGF